jgi:D-isomer specific 2-hydroxyacid dehydrogenase, catalytic domain
MSSEGALKILKSTSWFGGASEELLEALADQLKFVEAPEGHVFVAENEPMDQFMVVESGTLVRTKMHIVDSDDADDNKDKDKGKDNEDASPHKCKNRRRASMTSESLRNMNASQVSETIQQNAVVVDTVDGYGRVTGLLHSFDPGSIAFATVTAKTDARVWLMSCQDFRSLMRSNPDFMFDIMAIMATELRTGTKSLRNIMTQFRRGEGEDTSRDTFRVLCYDTNSWVSDALKPAVNAFNEDPTSTFSLVIDYTSERLGPLSATYAAGYEAVCTFVNDTADADTIRTLSRLGIGMIAQRAAGFDRIDTKAARAYGMTVARVPAYSPYAVAEMAIALLMAVNRKTTKANNRVKMANFALDAGLLGVDIHGKTVGVMVSSYLLTGVWHACILGRPRQSYSLESPSPPPRALAKLDKFYATSSWDLVPILSVMMSSQITRSKRPVVSMSPRTKSLLNRTYSFS